MQSLFPGAIIHDPAMGFTSNKKATVAFICVPTPNEKKGKLDSTIVEQVVKNAKEDIIIIRSTVQPGTCEKLEKLGKSICYMPEYLGETVNHPLFDDKNAGFLIVGGRPKNR